MRKRKCFVDGPPATDTFLNHTAGNPNAVAPIGKRKRDAVVRNEAVVRPVPRLSFDIRPSAILWRVRTVVVDSVKRTAERRRAHVRVEVVGVEPPFAHGNTAPAVVLPVLVRRVRAAMDHLRPPLVPQFTRETVCLVDALHSFARFLTLQASARQTARKLDYDLFATVASAKPQQLFVSIAPARPKCNKPPEAGAGMIFRSHCRTSRIGWWWLEARQRWRAVRASSFYRLFGGQK